MHYGKSVAAIILAAGQGTRFGGNTNKVYKPLDKKALLRYSVEAYDIHPEVDEIVLVIRQGEDVMTANYNTITPLRRIYGGDTRRESVLNGLEATRADIVLIHDGARPFVRNSYITGCLEAIDSFQGAAVAVRSKDTVKIVNNDGVVQETTDRAHTWLVQTPQCFLREDLLFAHRALPMETEYTDDCQMVEALHGKVKLVPGSDINLKITSQNDLFIAEQYIKSKMW